jgi:hypothetical protein
MSTSVPSPTPHMLTSNKGMPMPKQPRKKPITAKQLLHAIDVAVKKTLEQTAMGQETDNYPAANRFIACLSGVISVDDYALGDKIFSVLGHGRIGDTQ